MTEFGLSLMRPSDLRYTHDSVSCKFSNGIFLEDTFRELLYGDLDIDDIPCLVAMYYNGEWMVVRGNRRLYLYKKLQEIGNISTVQVDKTRFNYHLFDRQFTSQDMGLTVRIRGIRNMEEKLNQIANKWRNLHSNIANPRSLSSVSVHLPANTKNKKAGFKTNIPYSDNYNPSPARKHIDYSQADAKINVPYLGNYNQPQARQHIDQSQADAKTKVPYLGNYNQPLARQHIERSQADARTPISYSDRHKQQSIRPQLDSRMQIPYQSSFNQPARRYSPPSPRTEGRGNTMHSDNGNSESNSISSYNTTRTQAKINSHHPRPPFSNQKDKGCCIIL